MPRQDYDWDDWIIPPSDTKGHSVRKTFRLQPGHARIIEVLIAQKKFPFRTEGELIRWCVVRGSMELDATEPTGTSFLAVTEMMSDLVRDDMYNTDAEDAFHLVAERVQQVIDRGDINEARRMLTQTKGRIDRISNKVYRERMLKRFRHQFGGYLTAGATPPAIIEIPRALPDPTSEIESDDVETEELDDTDSEE